MSARCKEAALPDRKRLLCIAPSFYPETTPTAIRAFELTRLLTDLHWDVTVVTAAEGDDTNGVRRCFVSPPKISRAVFRQLRTLRLRRLAEILEWPDDKLAWVPGAVRRARALAEKQRFDAILVFMMPYSAGLAGIALSRILRLPLILNFDDSPTCSDMQPVFPSRLHALAARQLERSYIARSTSAIYVSETTRKRVAARLPAAERRKLHVIRYAGIPLPPSSRLPRREFRCCYIGGMNGWQSFGRESGLRAAVRRLGQLGRYQVQRLDYRGSSPVYLGRALKDLVTRRPEWRGRVRLDVIGNSFPIATVERVLAAERLSDVVRIQPPIPHEEAVKELANSDLLFLTLPARSDDSEGGRISAKTYEYLMSDAPILAAVPRGENQDYLRGLPGVFFAHPLDAEAMAAAVEPLVERALSGQAVRFDRSQWQSENTYEERAAELNTLLSNCVDHTA